MVAQVPAPQYIDLDAIVGSLTNLIGDKILFVDDTLPLNPNAINTTLANELIAFGEARALMDLSPYYVTVPALVTTTNAGDWTTLPYYTYTTLYEMFIYCASLQIIGNFIARNTDEFKRTLSDFQKYYQQQYHELLNRVLDRLPNGSYKYPLIGLQVTNTGIPRTPARYAIAGNLGRGNYTDGQVINPARNFDYFSPTGLPFGSGYWSNN